MRARRAVLPGKVVERPTALGDAGDEWTRLRAQRLHKLHCGSRALAARLLQPITAPTPHDCAAQGTS